MTVDTVTQILIWAGAGLGALGAVVLALGTLTVLLLGRDDSPLRPPVPQGRPVDDETEPGADLAAAA